MGKSKLSKMSFTPTGSPRRGSCRAANCALRRAASMSCTTKAPISLSRAAIASAQRSITAAGDRSPASMRRARSSARNIPRAGVCRAFVVCTWSCIVTSRRDVARRQGRDQVTIPRHRGRTRPMPIMAAFGRARSVPVHGGRGNLQVSTALAVEPRMYPQFRQIRLRLIIAVHSGSSWDFRFSALGLCRRVASRRHR